MLNRWCVPILMCAPLLGAEAPPPSLSPDRTDALLETYLEASDPAEAGAALRKILQETGIPLTAWVEAIRRRPAPPPPEGNPIRLQVPLPDGKAVRCLVVTPPGYDPAKPTPLLIVCHGTGCSADMSLGCWGNLAPPAGTLLACPDFVSLPDGWIFSDEERSVPLATLREMKRRFNVDEDRITLSGVSKGGHASWDLGFRFPHLFAGIVPEACRVFNHGLSTTGGFDYLENGLDLPAYQIEGALDDPPLVASMREAVKALQAKGADVTYVEFPDRGHAAYPDQYPDVLAWMARHARGPLPRKTFCRCHDLRYGRRAWTEILGFDDQVIPENPKKLSLKGKPPDSKEQLDRDKRRYMLAHSALLEAEIAGANQVKAKAQHVREFAVYLDADRFDLSKPIRVTVNGRKAFEGMAPPSVETLLRLFARDLDRRRLFVAEIRIRI
jgi:predicted esterase